MIMNLLDDERKLKVNELKKKKNTWEGTIWLWAE